VPHLVMHGRKLGALGVCHGGGGRLLFLAIVTRHVATARVRLNTEHISWMWVRCAYISSDRVRNMHEVRRVGMNYKVKGVAYR
jgi:hypothetical protein